MLVVMHAIASRRVGSPPLVQPMEDREVGQRGAPPLGVVEDGRWRGMVAGEVGRWRGMVAGEVKLSWRRVACTCWKVVVEAPGQRQSR